MVIRLDIETWVIDKGGTKKGVIKGGDWWRKWYGDFLVLWLLCVFVCISVVVVEGAYGVGGGVVHGT
jgi:hypothetical protein